MNKYISYYRRNKRYEHERDAIGLIICKEAGREEVMYALDGLEERIFIAKYKIKLPGKDEIKKKLKKLTYKLSYIWDRRALTIYNSSLIIVFS